MSYIEMRGLSKQYPAKEQWALKEFHLSIEKGEFIAIVGPSGSGKSTLLNMLTGFEQVSKGTFLLDKENVTDYSPKNRNIAMVFQEYALFPHMTVRDNIAFGMKVRKENRQKIKEKIQWAATSLELEELLHEKPKHLSGGQRQRVALARAIVREPKLFLLDEPLSNLDAKLREQTGALIRQVHDQLGTTSIFVTHAQDEAMSLADRIVLLKDGRIQQIGTPRELYETPNNLFTASFIGRPEINRFEGELDENGSLSAQDERLGVGFNGGEKQQVIVAVRSEDIHLSDEVNEHRGIIKKVRYMGSDQLLFVSWKDVLLVLRTPTDNSLNVGQKINFTIDQKKLFLFSCSDHKNLNEM